MEFDKIEDKQMHRIECIECVLPHHASHKPALPIIEPYGNKCHAGKYRAGQCTCAYDRHQQLIVSEQIEHEYKSEPRTSIVTRSTIEATNNGTRYFTRCFMSSRYRSITQSPRYPSSNVKNTFCTGQKKRFTCIRLNGISEISAKPNKFIPYFFLSCVPRKPSSIRNQNIGKAHLPLTLRMKKKGVISR